MSLKAALLTFSILVAPMTALAGTMEIGVVEVPTPVLRTQSGFARLGGSGNVEKLSGSGGAEVLTGTDPSTRITGKANLIPAQGRGHAAPLSGMGDTGKLRVVIPEPLPDPVPAPAQIHPAITLFDLHFAYDSAELEDSERELIADLAEKIRAAGPGVVEIHGHTDARGAANYNYKLSLARANAVKSALVQWHGFAADRFVTVGRGKDHLLDPGTDDEAHRRNRRVVVILP